MEAPTLALAPLLAAGIVVAAHGDTPVVEEIEPVRDTSIYSALDFSNGSGTGLFTGRTGSSAGGAANRALVVFDLSSIPGDADIVSVELRLFQEQAASGSGDRVMSLHRLLNSWGEAGSFSGNGFGAPPQPGDASWSKRFHPDVFWDVAGGDFVPAASSTAVSPQASEVYLVFSGPDLVADVEGWLDDPDANHGWILVGDESVPQTGRRYGSREAGNLDGRPTLVITYGGGPPACLGDLDESGDVGFGDLLQVLTAWGGAGGAIDLDGSGVVDFGDVLLILTNWGPC